MKSEQKPTGLALLREPFSANQISKLPKETKAQADARKADRNVAINCQQCGGWHHKHAIHLDYVGHAALTDRLLDADPQWSWEPLGFTPDGLPATDRSGGLWIKLTVCGVSRFGYGHAGDKSGGDAVKETIGDALRNAAMRFGAALDLWHKGQLHADDDNADEPQEPVKPATVPEPIGYGDWLKKMQAFAAATPSVQAFRDEYAKGLKKHRAYLEETNKTALDAMVAAAKGNEAALHAGAGVQ